MLCICVCALHRECRKLKVSKYQRWYVCLFFGVASDTDTNKWSDKSLFSVTKVRKRFFSRSHATLRLPNEKLSWNILWQIVLCVEKWKITKANVIVDTVNLSYGWAGLAASERMALDCVCLCGAHRLIYGSRWMLCAGFRHQIWPAQSFSHRPFCRNNAHPVIFMGLILWCHLWCFTKILIQNVIAHTTEKEIDWKWQILPQSSISIWRIVIIFEWQLNACQWRFLFAFSLAKAQPRKMAAKRKSK